MLVSPGSSAQILCAALIALAYLLVILKLAPYTEKSEDTLQFVATLQILLSLLIGFALKTQSMETGLYEDDLMDVLLVGSCVTMVIGGLYAFVIELPEVKEQKVKQWKQCCSACHLLRKSMHKCSRRGRKKTAPLSYIVEEKEEQQAQ